MTTPAELPDLPSVPPPGCPLAPPAGLTALPPVCEVRLADGGRAWLVRRHADIRAVLGDTEHFSSRPDAPGFPRDGIAGASAARTVLIRQDPPEHTRFRRMVTREFTVKRMAALEPRITELAERLCDEMAAGGRSADLVAAFALPLPSTVIGVLLGVPTADHPLFQGLTGTLLSRTATTGERLAARDRLREYLGRLLDGKAGSPGDDVLGRLITDHPELTREELLSFAAVLLIAGHETTANMIGLGALSLMLDPGLADRLRADPALLPGTVEELLRVHSIVRTGPRRAVVADVEIGGRLLHAGEGVVLSIPAGNHDEEVHPGPDVVDPARGDTGHLAFGFGVHQCLGQSLARVELRIALRVLLARFPGMRPTVPVEDIAFRRDMFIHGCHELPVTW